MTVTGGMVARRASAIAEASGGYRLGAESRPGSRGGLIDCSELVEQACAELGVAPTMPDGSWMQAQHCAGRQLPVDRALRTAGALLFRFSGPDLIPPHRPASAHVAVSLGDGHRTAEARSVTSGVGVFGDADQLRWTVAALVPGVDHKGVSRGDRSCRVAAVQQALRADVAPRLAIDGEFGPLTERAVRKWQRREGLPADGVVGAAQLDRLGVG